VRIFRAQQLPAAPGRPGAFPLAWQGPLQAFLTPDPVHPLVIDAPAIKPQPPVDKPPAPGSAVLTSAPRCLLAGQGAAEYCGVDLSTGMHAFEKPGIDHAEPPRPCDDAPGFIKLSIRQKALEAGVLQLKLLEAFGLSRFDPAI